MFDVQITTTATRKDRLGKAVISIQVGLLWVYCEQIQGWLLFLEGLNLHPFRVYLMPEQERLQGVEYSKEKKYLQPVEKFPYQYQGSFPSTLLCSSSTQQNDYSTHPLENLSAGGFYVLVLLHGALLVLREWRHHPRQAFAEASAHAQIEFEEKAATNI